MSNIEFPALPTTVPQTMPGTEHMVKPGRRAPMVSPHVYEIAQDVPTVAAALDKLTAAMDAIEAQASKVDDLADEYDTDRAEAKAAALAGKVKQTKPVAFWEARRDAIIEAHRALIAPAVNAQIELVATAAPYIEERMQRDRDEIRKLTDRLAILIGRSTPFIESSVVVDGFTPLGSVANVLRALRTIAKGVR